MKLTERIIARIKEQFEGEATGHDWYHIMRVFHMAKFIQRHEGGDLNIIECAALLHDISDYKFNGGDLKKGGELANQILLEEGASKELADQVKYIVDNISYKGSKTVVEMNSLEGQIVQDADRLDAVGAISMRNYYF